MYAARNLLTQLPKLQTRTFSSDFLSKMALLTNDRRLRPYFVPRVYKWGPRFRQRSSEDDYNWNFGGMFPQTTNIIRELNDLNRCVLSVFEDIPRKISIEGPDGRSPKTSERQISSTDEANKELSHDDATESEDKTKYVVRISVPEFRPEEIEVKVRDGYVTVEAEKELRDEKNGSYRYHQIQKHFLLPTSVDPDSVTCHLTKDGVLSIQAPWSTSPQLEAPRKVPVKNNPENEDVNTETPKESSEKMNS